MFRFTMKPSSGSHSQYVAKITHSVQCECMEVVQTLSVLWLHSMRVCCALCKRAYTAYIRSHSAQHTCLTGHTMQP